MTRAIKPITSLTNDRVKAIRALDMRKERKETGLFLAEGASIIMTARAAGFRPETLVYRAGALETETQRRLVSAALDDGAEVLEVSNAVLEKLAAKDNPQTMLGVFRQRVHALPDPKALPRNAVWLALEEIRDPGNLGTIIRTADAVGASGVILVGQCTDPHSREAVRATMGSVFNVPLVAVERNTFLEWLPRWPGDTVATTLAAREDFRDAKLTSPVLLMMGSEGPGLSEALTHIATRQVKIPMHGTLDSLNLAVATAILLYHLRGPDLKL
jgi:TrmH family RNA methyltransferase